MEISYHRVTGARARAARAGSSMHIRTIDRLEELERLREPWEAAYARDPHAQFFASWVYLRSWIEVAGLDWLVLAAAAQPDAPPVGFLPLARRARRWRGLPVVRQLHLAAKPFADYTGFVCVPEHAPALLEAFAGWIRSDPGWDQLVLAEVVDPRLDDFLAHFPAADFRRIPGESLVSPRTALHASWDEQLAKTMTSAGRYDVRRALRRTEQAPGFRVSTAGASDLEDHVDAMMALWQSRWGELEAEPLRRYREVFRETFARDALELVVVWDGDHPMAGVTSFVDPLTHTYYQYITAYDPKYSRRSPGRSAIAYCMQSAIERGFSTYDFLLGDEEYKYSFGAVDRTTTHVTLERRGWRTAAARLLRLR
jgi:CelD/BcsL family acetyltransferase involved in cellulose biosynthesis